MEVEDQLYNLTDSWTLRAANNSIDTHYDLSYKLISVHFYLLSVGLHKISRKMTTLLCFKCMSTCINKNKETHKFDKQTPKYNPHRLSHTKHFVYTPD